MVLGVGSRMEKESFEIGSAWAKEKLDASTKASTARANEVVTAVFAILREVKVQVVRYDNPDY